MQEIKLRVTGNRIEVTERPEVITSGTVGLPVKFVFDSQWDGLQKVAVFRAGEVIKDVLDPEKGATVPWEVLEKPNVWLSIGIYGSNQDGSLVIPTLWSNVGVVHKGADPKGDPATDPTLPIWQEILGRLNSGGGYVPVRGKDYWTEEDIAEIKSYVDEAILGGAW